MKILRTLALAVLTLIGSNIAKSDEPYIVSQTYAYTGMYFVSHDEAETIQTLLAGVDVSNEKRVMRDVNAVLRKGYLSAQDLSIMIVRLVRVEGNYNLVEALAAHVGLIYIVTTDPVIDRLQPET